MIEIFKSIICFFFHHKPKIIYRNNVLCPNLDKKTIQIWVMCDRCDIDLTTAEFKVDTDYFNQSENEKS